MPFTAFPRPFAAFHCLSSTFHCLSPTFRCRPPTQAPPILSASWFDSSERTTATAVMTTFNYLGQVSGLSMHRMLTTTAWPPDQQPPRRGSTLQWREETRREERRGEARGEESRGEHRRAEREERRERRCSRLTLPWCTAGAWVCARPGDGAVLDCG